MARRKFSYRAMLTAVTGCKRPVGFVDDQELDFWAAGTAAADEHLFSQTCAMCGQNHSSEDYAITDLERGEDNNGTYSYRTIYPRHSDEQRPQLELV